MSRRFRYSSRSEGSSNPNYWLGKEKKSWQKIFCLEVKILHIKELTISNIKCRDTEMESGKLPPNQICKCSCAYENISDFYFPGIHILIKQSTGAFCTTLHDRKPRGSSAMHSRIPYRLFKTGHWRWRWHNEFLDSGGILAELILMHSLYFVMPTYWPWHEF